MHEFGVCIDCGERSELRLPRRFPHICTRCLFPPPKRDERPTDGPNDMHGPSVIESLHNAASRYRGWMRSEFGYGEWS